MVNNIKWFCTLPAIVFCTYVVGESNSAEFLPLGDLSGGDFYSEAQGISPDGSVVVGVSNSISGMEAFRWQDANGMQGLDDLTGGDFDSAAFDASADGSVVVGYGTTLNGTEAFVWRPNDGMLGLGYAPGGTSESAAYAVSADGAVIVGTTDVGGSPLLDAFRWTETDGMVALGGFGDWNRANGVSADGSVVVGNSTVNVPVPFPSFRWTEATGMQLFWPPKSNPRAVTADGAIAAGSINIWHAGLLYEDGSIEIIGESPSNARDISADGEVVVGSIGLGNDSQAFIWDPVLGMRNLAQLLNDKGVDLAGWTLVEATGVSEDGIVIAGNGINQVGQSEAWMAIIPEPSSAITALLGLAGILTLRRRS